MEVPVWGMRSGQPSSLQELPLDIWAVATEARTCHFRNTNNALDMESTSGSSISVMFAAASHHQLVPYSDRADPSSSDHMVKYRV